MAHDVFVSYPAEAKTTADAVTAALESQGIRCWIAPRDVTPGSDWSESIVDAIQSSRLMVLIFDRNANQSQHIKREVERAVDANIAIIPMRIEDVRPNKGLSYFISSPHWLDAMTPPLEQHLTQLVHTVRGLLGQPADKPPAPIPYAAPASRQPPWASAAIIAGAILVVLGVGAWMIYRTVWPAYRGTGATATVAPTAPTPAPIPDSGRNRSHLMFHLERYISDLQKLDGQIASALGSGHPIFPDQPDGPRALGFDEVSDELIGQLSGDVRSTPLLSMFSTSQFGSRDDVFESFGASRDNLTAFERLVFDLQDAAGDVVTAVYEINQIKTLLELAARELPGRAHVAAPDFADQRLAAACRRYVASANRSQIAAARVLREIEGLPEELSAKLASMTHLIPIDPLATPVTDVDAAAQVQVGIIQESQQATADARKARSEFDRALARQLTAPIAQPQQPRSVDTPAEVIGKARSLRAEGKIDDAIAAFIAYGIFFRQSDRGAIDYAQAAVNLTRSAEELGFAGGLYVTESREGTPDYYAGVMRGNVLLAYDGRRVATSEDLAAAINAAPAQGTVRIDLLQPDDTGTWVRRTGNRPASAPIEAVLLPI